MPKCPKDCTCGKHRNRKPVAAQPKTESKAKPAPPPPADMVDRTANTQQQLAEAGRAAAQEFAAGNTGPSFAPPGFDQAAAEQQFTANAAASTTSTPTPPAIVRERGRFEPPVAETPLPHPSGEEHQLVYHDDTHRYYLDGKRAKSVSAVAKLAADDYQIRLWNERMVALGVTISENLRENIAMHAENKDRLRDYCEEAKKAAQAHLKADRGSQKHRVLELILLGEEHKLITEQQRRDAVILKRTLDRYKLVPHGELTEHFVAYPEYCITGRFDAVLDFEKPDGTTVLVDLKSGENAIKYPHSTLSQLAMYAYAPFVSVGDVRGDKVKVTQWRTMPPQLDLKSAYVLLVDNETDVGTFHRLDIEHGFKAAKLSMEMLQWRKDRDNGMGAVVQIDWDPLVDEGLGADIAAITHLDDLRALYKVAFNDGFMTDNVKFAFEERAKQIGAQQQ